METVKSVREISICVGEDGKAEECSVRYQYLVFDGGALVGDHVAAPVKVSLEVVKELFNSLEGV